MPEVRRRGNRTTAPTVGVVRHRPPPRYALAGMWPIETANGQTETECFWQILW